MRSPVLALVGILAACATSREPVTSPKDSFELQATQRLLAWLIERSALPGFDREPADARAIDQAQRILVACDYLDPGIPLSSDSRVSRPTPAELEAMWLRHSYDKTVYVWMSRIPSYQWSSEPPVDHLALSLKYSFGNAGAQRYEFAFWLVDEVLRAAGFLVGSS